MDGCTVNARWHGDLQSPSAFDFFPDAVDSIWPVNSRSHSMHEITAIYASLGITEYYQRIACIQTVALNFQ